MTGLRQHHSAPAAPRDRGRAFGEAEAPRIAHTLANYRAYWDLRAGEPFDPTPWGGQAREAIRAHAPHLADAAPPLNPRRRESVDNRSACP